MLPTAKLRMCHSNFIGTSDAEPLHPAFVVVFAESSDPAVQLELVDETDETGILTGPPDGQKAHIEARVSARGGMLKTQAVYWCLLGLFGL